MANYTVPNVTNDFNTGLGTVNPAIDTGVAGVPNFQAKNQGVGIFTPAVGYVAPTSVGQGNFGVAGNDWSMGTTPAVRPKVFEPPTYTATIDLGLAVNG
jgi:hypothetical protein